jgi:hypothetical protein
VKTCAALDAIVGDVQHDQPTHVPRDESLFRHPIRATEVEAAHLRKIVDEGESPATLAIVVAAVLAFVVPVAALLILLDFGIAHFA